MGYYPQESLYKPYKYHGYTVRGTPNCPLIDIHPGKLPNDWLENKTIEDVSPIENSDFPASRFSFCGGT